MLNDRILRVVPMANPPINNEIAMPSHEVFKNSKRVGTLSIGRMPLVMLYLDPTEVHRHDSMIVAGTVDSLMACSGTPVYAIAVHKTSPSATLMPKLDCIAADDFQLFYKSPYYGC